MCIFAFLNVTMSTTAAGKSGCRATILITV